MDSVTIVLNCGILLLILLYLVMKFKHRMGFDEGYVNVGKRTRLTGRAEPKRKAAEFVLLGTENIKRGHATPASFRLKPVPGELSSYTKNLTSGKWPNPHRSDMKKGHFYCDEVNNAVGEKNGGKIDEANSELESANKPHIIHDKFENFWENRNPATMANINSASSHPLVRDVQVPEKQPKAKVRKSVLPPSRTESKGGFDMPTPPKTASFAIPTAPKQNKAPEKADGDAPASTDTKPKPVFNFPSLTKK